MKRIICWNKGGCKNNCNTPEYYGCNGETEKVVQCCAEYNGFYDTIEALRREVEQYQERLKEIETTAKAIIRDRTEPDKVLIMAEDIEKMCGIVGEKITEALVYRNRKLQQENKQLRAHVMQMREALREARETIILEKGLIR